MSRCAYALVYFYPFRGDPHGPQRSPLPTEKNHGCFRLPCAMKQTINQPLTLNLALTLTLTLTMTMTSLTDQVNNLIVAPASS